MRIHALSVGILLACTASTMMAQVASAPCFEPNLGTMLGRADDFVFPGSALGFTFNYGGTGYTDIQVSSNGFAWLGNTVNFNSRCCAGTGATFVTDPPSVAALWTDLNADTGSNGVWFNALPGRAVVTWDNVIEYGGSTRFTIQLQLTALGEVTFWYSPTTAIGNSFHTAVAGITVGNGANNPGSIDLSASFPFNSSAEPTVYEEWAGGGFDLSARTWELIPNGNNGYLGLDRSGCLISSSGSFTPYGTGCPPLAGNPNAEFYQFFVPGSGFDLSGTAIEMIPIGSQGYLVQSANLNANWFAGFTNATNIGDDQVIPTPLPFSFPHPGGATSSIGLCSNGFLHLGSNVTAPFTCSVAGALGGDACIFGAWTDWYRPGAGQVFSDQVSPTKWAFTWSGVAEFANTTAAGTWQIQVENTGRVVLLYQSIAIASHNILVGYARGGGVPDPGNTDISAAMPFLTGTGVQPLVLGQDSGNPVIGASYRLRVSQQPIAAVAAFLVLSFTQFPSGVPLDSLGMPGCHQYVALDESMFHAIGAPATIFSLNVPNNVALVGLSVYAQAAEVAPGVNALGVAASNGGTLVIGTF